MRESKRHAFATVFFANADRIMLVRPLGKVLIMSEISYEQSVKDITSSKVTWPTWTWRPMN